VSGSLQWQLLPSGQTTADRCGQMPNIDPAHDRRRTVLDDLLTPTDQQRECPGARPTVRARRGVGL
jgi:hypothetical protein